MQPFREEGIGALRAGKRTLRLYTQVQDGEKKEKFFKMVLYMDGYLDVDASSDLGRYYLQSL